MRARTRLLDLLRDDRGVTSIEYAFICALIFLAVIASIGSTGANLGGRWTNMAGEAAANMQKY